MQDWLEQRLDYIGLEEDAEARLALIAVSLERHLDAGLQRLAGQVSSLPGAMRFLYGRERVEGDGGGSSAHWRDLVAGKLDSAFADTATRTGQRFARLGLDPGWHAGGRAIVAETLIRGVIHDGMAAALHPRRGPLGLLGQPDRALAFDLSDAMADGLSALVGAVVLDLDLTFAGYMDKLRLDADAAVAAEKTRLARAVEDAGRVLALAADGQCDRDPDTDTDPVLVPLFQGAEKLADRVAGLVDDLDVAGQATEALARDVLAAADTLLDNGTAHIETAEDLTVRSRDAAEGAQRVVKSVDALLRHLRTSMRQLAKARRDVRGDPVGTAPARREAVERLDALGLAANLLAARLASPASGHREGKSADADLRALATGLSQLAMQMRMEDERAEAAARAARAEEEQKSAGLASLTEDLGQCLKQAGALNALGKDLAQQLVAVTGLSTQLQEQLAQSRDKDQAAQQCIRQALAGAGALVDFATAFTEAETEAPPQSSGMGLTPDQTALAAHWHMG